MDLTIAGAPGKIILFGEHAVVYGRPAIAVPVQDVRATAEVKNNPDAGTSTVFLEAPDIGFSGWLHAAPVDHPLAKITIHTLQALGLTSFPAIKLKVTSTIPVAAGLGSGTAVSVAVVRALSTHLATLLPPEQQSSLAFEVEKLHHGTPSGIDNTVVAFERPVYYLRDRKIKPFSIRSPFNLLIGDTGIASNTSVAVGNVRKGWNADPSHYEQLFDAIGQISEQARQAIQRGPIGKLGPLMDRNQDILHDLGVSCRELDDLVSAAISAGALGAKLSGAGLGGNMIALVEPETQDAIEVALREAGAVRVLRTEVQT